MAELNNFHYALTLANMLYDVEVDTEDGEEIALIAYNQIGNKNTHLKRVFLDLDPKTLRAKLPCDCDLIEAITYVDSEDWNYTSNVKDYGDVNSLWTEDYIEGSKAFLDPLYLKGKFVKYRREGEYIYVNKGFGRICLLYHTQELDEDGLPQITDKEATAIATYIAYTLKYKEAIKTNNANSFEIAKNLKLQWLMNCERARVPDYVNQNEMDMLLDTKATYNRKKYGYSFKPTL